MPRDFQQAEGQLRDSASQQEPQSSSAALRLKGADSVQRWGAQPLLGEPVPMLGEALRGSAVPALAHDPRRTVYILSF